MIMEEFTTKDRKKVHIATHKKRRYEGPTDALTTVTAAAKKLEDNNVPITSVNLKRMRFGTYTVQHYFARRNGESIEDTNSFSMDEMAQLRAMLASHTQTLEYHPVSDAVVTRPEEKDDDGEDRKHADTYSPGKALDELALVLSQRTNRNPAPTKPTEDVVVLSTRKPKSADRIAKLMQLLVKSPSTDVNVRISLKRLQTTLLDHCLLTELLAKKSHNVSDLQAKFLNTLKSDLSVSGYNLLHDVQDETIRIRKNGTTEDLSVKTVWADLRCSAHARFVPRRSLEKKLSEKWTVGFDSLQQRTQQLYLQGMAEKGTDAKAALVLAVMLACGARQAEILRPTFVFDALPEDTSLFAGMQDIREYDLTNARDSHLLRRRMMRQIGIAKGSTESELRSTLAVQKPVLFLNVDEIVNARKKILAIPSTKHILSRAIARRFKDHFTDMHLASDNRCKPHDLRGVYAEACYKFFALTHGKERNLEFTSAVLGHTGPLTTSVYYKGVHVDITTPWRNLSSIKRRKLVDAKTRDVKPGLPKQEDEEDSEDSENIFSSDFDLD